MSNTIQSTNLKSKALYLKQVIWGLIWKYTNEKGVKQMLPMWLFCNWNCCEYAYSQTGKLRTELKTTVEKEEEKCNKCDYASSQTGDLRSHLKIHGRKKGKTKATTVWQCKEWRQIQWLQLVWLASSQICNLRDHFENKHWRKVKQMQPVWLCIFSNRQFEDSFENTQWR